MRYGLFSFLHIMMPPNKAKQMRKEMVCHKPPANHKKY